MKKRIILIISILLICTSHGYAQEKKCPSLSELEQTSIKNQREVIEALNTLIPNTYGTGIDDFPDMYTKWNVLTAKPFPDTVGHEDEEAYYGIAKTFCGKEIANRSWLVRLDFPKAPGASLGQGQLFLAKSKDNGWFVWYQYH